MLLYGMRKILGQVAFTVAVLISAFAKICIAIVANMLVLHTIMVTFHLFIAYITEEISVITVTRNDHITVITSVGIVIDAMLIALRSTDVTSAISVAVLTQV